MVDLTGAMSYASFFLVFATAYAIISLGLNLQWGFTGLFNVGVAGFVAIGAKGTFDATRQLGRFAFAALLSKSDLLRLWKRLNGHLLLLQLQQAVKQRTD
jgi:ABC-type branched-subunit amino acid transport system permease subunit